VFIVSVIFLK